MKLKRWPSEAMLMYFAVVVLLGIFWLGKSDWQATKTKPKPTQLDRIERKVDDSIDRLERIEQLQTTATPPPWLDSRARQIIWQRQMVSRGGDWIARIDSYLEGSRLAGQGRIFYLAAAQEELDPRLMPAIAEFESILGNSNLGRNNLNFFGRKTGSGGWRSYASVEQAIYDQAHYLRVEYFNRGYTTLAAINSKYAPGGGENSTWAATVARNMARI